MKFLKVIHNQNLKILKKKKNKKRERKKTVPQTRKMVLRQIYK